MKDMYDVIAGKRVGLITAHPDDHASQVHGSKGASAVYEHVQTRGRESTKNYREAEGFSVKGGGRNVEALRGAARMGIDRVSQRNLPDGLLTAEIPRAVRPAAAWIVRNRIDVVLTLGGLRDHQDHTATGAIGELAATFVQETTGREVRVFDLYADGSGDHVAEATPDGMARAYEVLGEHGSQFRTSRDVEPGWTILPGGLSMHPEDAAALNQYPLIYDATYRERAVGGLIVPELAQLTLAGTR